MSETQGPLYPSIGANYSYGGTDWTNPSDIVSDNSTFASVATGGGSGSSNLTGTSFGFSIPSGATIDGIKVEIKRYEGAASHNMEDVNVVIRKANSTFGSTNKATYTEFPTVSAYETYGGVSDLWGETWTPSDINNANFGIGFSSNNGFTSSGTAYVDTMRITVSYTVPSFNPAMGHRKLLL